MSFRDVETWHLHATLITAMLHAGLPKMASNIFLSDNALSVYVAISLVIAFYANLKIEFFAIKFFICLL